jgi:hypothetical protein
LAEFVVSGRGSLPPNPLQPLNGTTSIAPLATLESDRVPNTSQAPIKPPTPPTAIIEAQGWVKTPDGKIVLVALAPQATPSRRQLGVVLQGSRLMSASIFENISSNAVLTMDEAWEVGNFCTSVSYMKINYALPETLVERRSIATSLFHQMSLVFAAFS